MKWKGRRQSSNIEQGEPTTGPYKQKLTPERGKTIARLRGEGSHSLRSPSDLKKARDFRTDAANQARNEERYSPDTALSRKEAPKRMSDKSLRILQDTTKPGKFNSQVTPGPWKTVDTKTVGQMPISPSKKTDLGKSLKEMGKYTKDPLKNKAGPEPKTVPDHRPSQSKKGRVGVDY